MTCVTWVRGSQLIHNGFVHHKNCPQTQQFQPTGCAEQSLALQGTQQGTAPRLCIHPQLCCAPVSSAQPTAPLLPALAAALLSIAAPPQHCCPSQPLLLLSGCSVTWPEPCSATSSSRSNLCWQGIAALPWPLTSHWKQTEKSAQSRAAWGLNWQSSLQNKTQHKQGHGHHKSELQTSSHPNAFVLHGFGKRLGFLVAF